jgi:TonB family protein
MLVKIIVAASIWLVIQPPALSDTQQESYQSLVEGKVEKQWLKGKKHKDGKAAVVLATIDTTGKLQQVSIVTSSKDPSFDRDVIQCVKKAAPYGACPSEMGVNISLTSSGIIHRLLSPAALSNNEGVQALKNNQFGLAIAKFREAIRLDRSYLVAKENLASTYFIDSKGKTPAEAIILLEHAVYWNPGSRTIQKRLNDCIRDTERDPSAYDVRIDLAKAAQGRGDKEAAATEYAAALTIRPDDQRTRLLLKTLK